MSKALTPVNQNDKGEIDSIAERLIEHASHPHFPSYFGNFGIFNPFLVLHGETPLAKRRLSKEQEFTLITAIMAIV